MIDESLISPIIQECNEYIPFESGSKEFSIANKKYTFSTKVWNMIELEDGFIVSVPIYQFKNELKKFDYLRYVFKFDFSGKILWQVGKAYYIDTKTGEKVYAEDCIHTVFKGPTQRIDYEKKCMVPIEGSENKVYVHGRLGYEVDLETGELKNVFSWEK